MAATIAGFDSFGCSWIKIGEGGSSGSQLAPSTCLLLFRLYFITLENHPGKRSILKPPMIIERDGSQQGNISSQDNEKRLSLNLAMWELSLIYPGMPLLAILWLVG